MNTAFPIVTPDLTEFFDLRKRDLKSELNCVTIGTINKFDAATQTAEISVNFLRVVKGAIPATADNPQGYLKFPYPLLVSCPVMFLSGGLARITMPITAGDTCIVLLADKDIDTWFTSGQVQAPNSDRTHDLNDGIAIVGIRSMLNKVEDYSATDLEILFSGGRVNVIDRMGERLCQSGFLQPYAGSTAPSGWLLCYGQSISKTTYPDLFAVIGYTYGGSGDNFSVPDMRGRGFIGLDNIGGSNANVLTNTITPNRNTLGGSTGQETVNLQHNHGGNTGGVNFGGAGSLTAGVLDTAHYHSITNDLSATQTVMQPSRLGNWLIKI